MNRPYSKQFQIIFSVSTIIMHHPSPTVLPFTSCYHSIIHFVRESIIGCERE